MAKKKNYPPGTKEDVENIVGLFLMTFGQGVNPLHVNRSTVRAIRDQLVPPITRAVKANDWNEVWKREAATVLGWMAAVGRMAAQIAMEPKDRRSVVRPSDFEEAFEVVIANHAPKEQSKEQATLGKWCS